MGLNSKPPLRKITTALPGDSIPELRDLGSDVDKLLGLKPPSQQDLEISRLAEQNRLLKHALLDLHVELENLARRVLQNFEELNK